MMTRPPAPDEPLGGSGGYCHGGDPAAARRARLASMWAHVLERFRDYLHWTMDVAVDVAGSPSNEPGGQHDPDT